MRIAGDGHLHAPGRGGVGRAPRPRRPGPHHPRVRAPGDDRGENSYAMTVTVGVAAIRGTYAGTCTLADLEPADSLGMRPQGTGAPGTIDADRRRCGSPSRATARTRSPTTRTRSSAAWSAGSGQRMLASVSTRMAAEFFGDVDEGADRAGPPAAPAARRPGDGADGLPPAAAGASPRRPAPLRSEDFLTGSRRRRRAGAARGARRRTRGGRSGRLSVGVDLRPRLRGAAPWRRPCGRGRSPPASCSSCTSSGSHERQPATLNAIVSLDEERARAGAAAADEHAGLGADRSGPLHGLPFAFKDTHAVAGWRTTYGSPVHADHVPDRRRAGRGAHPAGRRRGRLGKTNVPEFAAGSHTFNPIFGTTLNPWRPRPARPGAPPGRGGRPGHRHGAARRRQRHGRVAAQPGVLLQRRRAPALARPGPGVAAPQRVGDHVGRRADGPVGRGPRAPAVGARRSGPAGAARPLRPGSAFAPPLSGSLDGLRVALSVDLGGAFEVDDAVAAVEGVGRVPSRRRRAGPSSRTPTLPRGRGHLPHAARLALPGAASASCSPSTPTRSSRRWPTTSGPGSR